LKDYATISVPREVKKDLEKMKEEKEWGEFLSELSKEAKRLRSLRALSQLSSRLTAEELDGIEESSKRFREGLVLR
jgi:predicted CopG family antitoxin